MIKMPVNKSPLEMLSHAVATLQERGSQSSLNGMGIYITLSLGLLIASLILHNSVRFVERTLVFIAFQPLFLPVFIGLGLVSIYLAVVSSVTISRERDRGTLEVLMYGPVNEVAFILGAFFSQLKVYLVALLITFIWANLVTWALHLSYSLNIFWIMLSSIGMAGVVIAFGIFTAVWGGRTRTALIYFFLAVLLLAGIQIGDQVVRSIVASVGENSADSLLLLRNVLAYLSNYTQWISPYSQFALILDSFSDGVVGSFLLHFGILALQCILLLVISVLVLKKMGVRG